MFMWDESNAKRGCDEICSALVKYFNENKPIADEIVVFTDNCARRNKNWCVMGWQLVRDSVFMKITHHFLVSGHTHLLSDRDFAHIENYKKKMSATYELIDWVAAVRKSRRSNPLRVYTKCKVAIFLTLLV